MDKPEALGFGSGAVNQELCQIRLTIITCTLSCPIVGFSLARTSGANAQPSHPLQWLNRFSRLLLTVSSRWIALHTNCSRPNPQHVNAHLSPQILLVYLVNDTFVVNVSHPMRSPKTMFPTSTDWAIYRHHSYPM